ncbi:MAG TPA: 3'-5' exonuclease [candidate division Zixibacteria bacterium]|nr:3'-5' exonuclease [candidate division Zixibacteria bacterium]
MASTPIDKAKFLVIDCEMTGLDPSKHEIIEVAGLPVEGFAIGGEPGFYSEIEPERSIPADTKAVHGLRGKELAQAPLAIDVLPEFVKLFYNRIIVGHNVAVDVEFLRRKSKRVGMLPPRRPMIDTMRLAGAIWPNKSRAGLDEIIALLEIEAPKSRHNALDDARITAEAFVRMTHRLKGEGRLSTVADILRIGGV